MITRRNIVRHELIGLEVEILESSDSTLKGLKGKVMDETRNTLIIEVKDKRKVIPKGICTFAFNVRGDFMQVPGSSLIGRPQDRIKR